MSERTADDLESLFREASLDLRRFAARRLHDSEAAADVVQEAFARAAAAFPGGSAGAIEHPRFFLWRIVSNLTIDAGRRARLRLEPDGTAEDVTDPAPTAEPLLEARERVARLRAALERLPERPREALLLSRIDGLTHAEIGERLGVSASMISKEIMRALRHCSRALRG